MIIYGLLHIFLAAINHDHVNHANYEDYLIVRTLFTLVFLPCLALSDSNHQSGKLFCGKLHLLNLNPFFHSDSSE